MRTIIVTDKKSEWDFLDQDIPVVSSTDYLQQPEYSNTADLRVINVCRSYSFQSKGYYVSLLAEAHNHKVLPTVMTIQDIKSPSLAATLTESITDDIQKAFASLKSDEFVLSVYFGKNIAKRYDNLCRKLHGLFPMPLFRVHFAKKKTWVIQKIHPISFPDIPEAHRDFFKKLAEQYYARKRFRTTPVKKNQYDLAILYNPNEKNPPSDPDAIKLFCEAGNELGINVEVIERADAKLLTSFNALFIRETTAVNHHTYRISRRASSEGLVVIDDPVSILKCANKVYLAEHLRKHHIPTPQTHILSANNYREFSQQCTYPIVLKNPSSAFSMGVCKVDNAEQLILQVSEYLKQSDLIIAQSFMPSEFDWRVGILNNQVIFVCRYYMAKEHWQIYNWQGKNDEISGAGDTLEIDQTPEIVIQTALKSTKTIGNGLYGVDIKLINGVAYVIEINDNPNVDSQMEDLIAGKALYQKIMSVFLERMQHLHEHER